MTPIFNKRVSRALRIVKLMRSLGDFDSNVLGMAGEVIAQEILGMTKTRTQCRGIDGHILDGTKQCSVQVKTLSARRIATKRPLGGSGFRVASGDHPQRLVVVVVFTKLGEYEIVFNGKTKSVGRLGKVNGVEKRSVCMSDLYQDMGRLQELVTLCKSDL